MRSDFTEYLRRDRMGIRFKRQQRYRNNVCM